MSDILDSFSWHSSFNIDEYIHDKKRITKIASNSPLIADFISVKPDSKYLVHKATKALWRWSDDGSCIEPVFEEDVLNEKDIKE